MRTGYIYALLDPRHPEGHPKHIRYVGLTFNLKKRMQGHWDDMKRKRNHKNSWLKSLANSGYERVTFEVIEAVECSSDTDLCDAEIYWIAQFKAWGFNLTNCTSGGEGVHDLPESIRKKMGEAITARLLALGDKHPSKTPEFRRKASERMKDPDHPVRSAEARRKNGLARLGMNSGPNATSKRPEVRKKISEGKKGDKHPSKRPEWRLYFSKLMKGRFVGDLNPSKKPGVGAKISAGRKGLSMGVDHPRSKKVMCVETQQVFVCLEDAARWLRVNGFPKASSCSVSGVCVGRCKQAYKFTWQFVE